MKVLIQCGDHLENQRRVILLARILYQNNVSPLILMYKKNKGSIFKSEGFEVVFLEDYENSTHEYGVIDPKDLLDAEARRNSKLIWPSQYQKNLKKSVEYLSNISKIIEENHPDHICIWNGFTGFVANALRIISKNLNIPHSFMERGLFKDSLFIDRLGVNGASSLSSMKSDVWNEIEVAENLQFYCNKIFQLDKEKKSYSEKKYKIIFFPLQVQLDTNIIYYSPFKTMREAFINIYDRFNDGKTLFVLRPHPEEVEEFKLNFPVYQNLLISAEKSLEYWIDNSDIIVTINSTVGLEALIAGKQVVCIGESIYSRLDSVSRWDDNILNINNPKEIKNYLCYLIKNNLIKSDSVFSSLVASKNIGFPLIENKKKLKYEFIINGLREFLNKERVYTIGLNFNMGKKLDLTYRENNVPITIDYIKKLIFDIFGDIDFYFEKNIDSKNDISIVDNEWSGGEFKGDVVIDIYGQIKFIKGNKIL